MLFYSHNMYKRKLLITLHYHIGVSDTYTNRGGRMHAWMIQCSLKPDYVSISNCKKI